MGALRSLAAEKMSAHRQQFVGRELEAITLNTPAADRVQGRTSALTENFLPAEVNAILPANELFTLRIAGLNADLTLQAAVRTGKHSRTSAILQFERFAHFDRITGRALPEEYHRIR
jgi:hypothetical protein